MGGTRLSRLSFARDSKMLTPFTTILDKYRQSPIEWIMERYAVTVNKDSQIRNDPNDWCREHGRPRYILDLIGRIVNVSIQTLDLMASLPQLSFKT